MTAFFIALPGKLRLYWLPVLIFVNLIVSAQPGSTKNQSHTDIVKIGLLIPDKNSFAAKQAADMAIQEANENPVLKGKKFELVIRSLEGPWGAGSKEAVDMIFKDEVWAILGSHDGRNAHPVEQVAAKTQMIFLSAWATDPSLSYAFVPWFFSVVPNDFQQSDALIAEVYNNKHLSKIAIVSDRDYDSKITLQSFLTQNKSAGKPEPASFQYDNSFPDFKELLGSLKKSKFDAIILLGQSKASIELVKKLRAEKIALPIFCTLSAGSGNEDWLGMKSELGKVQIITSLQYHDSKSTVFEREFKYRYGESPDAIAIFAYDGMNILIEGVIKSGFNKEKLREAIANLNYPGVSGLIRFDQRGNRTGLPELMDLNANTVVIMK